MTGGGGAFGGGSATGGGTAGSSGGGTAGSSGGGSGPQLNALISLIDDGGFSVDGGCADGGCVELAGYSLSGLMVTYVRGLYDGGDLPGFFVQAAPAGPAIFVEAADGGVSPGAMVTFTVLDARRRLSGSPRSVTLYSGLTISSQGNPLGPWEQDISGVDFTLPGQLDVWESRLIRVNGTTNGTASGAGTGYTALNLATIGSPDAGAFLRLRLETPLFSQQDLAAGCDITLRGAPLWRFASSAQPMAYRASELAGSTCPAPNLLSAAAQSNTSVLATFDRNMMTAGATAFTIDGGPGSSPSVVLATQPTPRVYVLTTSAMSSLPYELSCSATMTDTRGRALSQRRAPFTGIAPGPGTCAPVVISEVYTGGGNANAVLNADYVELKNRSSQSINLTGWTLSYQSATSSIWSPPFTLSGSLPAGGVIVVQAGGSGAVGAPLTPDLLWGQALGAGGGKLALVAGGTPGAACPAVGSVTDLVGYGSMAAPCSEGSPALAPTSAQALTRINDRCEDTNLNLADFAIGAPGPRGNQLPCSLSCSPDGG